MLQGPYQPTPEVDTRMTRRASLSTAALAVPIQGASSYTHIGTPSWASLVCCGVFCCCSNSCSCWLLKLQRTPVSAANVVGPCQ